MNHQISLSSAQKNREKEGEKELEKRMPGLHFECYERDPAMKEEAHSTLRVQEE